MMLGKLENDHTVAHIGACGDILLWRFDGRSEGRAQRHASAADDIPVLDILGPPLHDLPRPIHFRRIDMDYHAVDVRLRVACNIVRANRLLHVCRSCREGSQARSGL